MKNIKYLVVIMTAMFCSLSLYAQSSQMGYFLDGYMYKYRLNPAFQDETGFVGVGIANIEAGASSNAGLSNFIYHKDGKFVTGLHPSVSSSEFLGGLKKNTVVGVNFDETIFAAGVKRGSFYHTFDISVKADMSANVPDDIFRFMKNGMADGSSFNLQNLNFSGKGYAEVAYGLSVKLTDRLTAGARAKLLLGLGYADACINKVNFVADKSGWRLDAQGSFNASFGNLKYNTVSSSVNPGQQAIDLSSIKRSDFGLNGIGGAIDLGLEYDIVPGLKLSAAVLDLGVMNWNKCIKGVTSENVTAYEPADDIDLLGTGSGNIEEALKKIKGFCEFYPDGSSNSVVRRLTMTVNAGIEYVLPFYEPLSIAALGSWRNGIFSDFSEVRCFANWKIQDWIALSVSCAKNTFGFTYGAALSIHTKGFNFFIGADTNFTKVSREFIPINGLGSNAIFGINLGI